MHSSSAHDSTLFSSCSPLPVAVTVETPRSGADERIVAFKQLILDLAEGIGHRLVFAPELDLLEEVIELLPLSNERREAAIQHSKNARFDLQRGEFGAATYELRLLVGKVSRGDIADRRL